MTALEGALVESGAVAWQGVNIADVVFLVNGELSALGRKYVNDRQIMNHVKNHVDFTRVGNSSAVTAVARRPPEALSGELLVSVDDDSAAGQLWTALEELKHVQRILHDQFIKNPQHLAYDKEGNPLGSPRISAKEVQAYVQTVKAMKEMVDSLQKIRSGEHALQVAIRTGVDEALGDVHVRVTEAVRRMISEVSAKDLSSNESAALLEEWISSGGSRQSFETLILEARESSFRVAARLQGVSADSVRR